MLLPLQFFLDIVLFLGLQRSLICFLLGLHLFNQTVIVLETFAISTLHLTQFLCQFFLSLSKILLFNLKLFFERWDFNEQLFKLVLCRLKLKLELFCFLFTLKDSFLILNLLTFQVNNLYPFLFITIFQLLKDILAILLSSIS